MGPVRSTIQQLLHRCYGLTVQISASCMQETLLLSEDELRQIWYMMEELGSYTDSGEEVRINYDAFSQVRRAGVLHGAGIAV